MEVSAMEIPEVKLLRLKKHGDQRGFFSETYSRRELVAAGITCDFVQDNHSLSVPSGVVRGLHFQVPPFAQHKLVRVTRGAIFDVAVDVRRGSPSYGRHVAAVLTADEWNQIFIPSGFAHGLCTLEPNTEVLYKVSAYYAPRHDRGLLWDDPALAIDWPVAPDRIILSEKDRRHPVLAELPPYFSYPAEFERYEIAS
jgi:dTDP-4-dehydrorhamnose 3,5-epimerase